MTPSPALHAVLVHPEIPWNTGNAGRICLAFGARLHLVRPLGFALTARELRRAGLDYWDRVEPVLWARLDELEAALPELGEPFLFSAEAEKMPRYWYSQTVERKTVAIRIRLSRTT